MLLLALDTASAAVTVAVHDGTRVLAQFPALDQPDRLDQSGLPVHLNAAAPSIRHAELLTPAIEQVLAGLFIAPRELTHIAVGVGPGPFTGLRVGLATARVMSLALDIPILGICSLDAVALGAVRTGLDAASLDTAASLDAAGSLDAAEFLVAIDARRREVYWAPYRIGAGGLPIRLGEPQVGPAAEIPRDGRPVAGRGAELYPDALGVAVPPLDPAAGDLATLAVAGEPYVLEPAPLYLRRPDAKVPGARKRVRP